jgi:hypothetical protein
MDRAARPVVLDRVLHEVRDQAFQQDLLPEDNSGLQPAGDRQTGPGGRVLMDLDH